MVMGIFADQNKIHHKEAAGENIFMIITLGFPVYGVSITKKHSNLIYF
jgi:hypothetical protein